MLPGRSEASRTATTPCRLQLCVMLGSRASKLCGDNCRLHCDISVHKHYVVFFLVGKPEGKRPLGRPRRRWVDNIRMDLQEVGCGYVDWIGLTQDRDRWRMLVSTVMNLWVP